MGSEEIWLRKAPEQTEYTSPETLIWKSIFAAERVPTLGLGSFNARNKTHAPQQISPTGTETFGLSSEDSTPNQPKQLLTWSDALKRVW